jgi:hypothetical protein
MNELNSNTDLRAYLARAMKKLEDGETSPSVANAAANLCGKVISSVRTDLEYYKMTGQKPNVPFIQETKEKKSLENK